MTDRTLTIRYTSDTHGYLFPTLYAYRAEQPMGLMKLAAEYPHDGNTLILDGGDTIQGSPMANFYHRLSPEERHQCLPQNRWGENPFAAMMNIAGYQFVTLGNHDFNNGLDALADYLENLDALCLCANIRDRAGRLPIAPYAVHQLENGLRIGLVGACTHFVRRWEKPETVEQLVIEDPVEAAARALDAIRPLCDVTILIYHGGFECDLETGQQLTDLTENQACRICRTLDFDLVLTGHQHMRVDGVRFGHSFAVQPAYRAPHVCAITVTVHADGSKAFESEILPAQAAPMPEAATLLSPLEARVQAWLDEPAGHLDRPLDVQPPLEMARNGSALANFFNTVFKDASGAQVSSCALGNEIKGLPRDVTVRDIVSAYIYSNTLRVLELTGAELRAYVERAACYFALDERGELCVSDEFLRPKVQHYQYEYLLGIDYVIDVHRPKGQRVISMRFSGRELRNEEKISLCVSSYRASGTGGYDMLLGKRILRDDPTDVVDLLVAYIMDHPEIKVDTHRYCTVIV